MLKGPHIPPSSGGKAKKLVVLFHGYGSNGQDLVSLAESWSSAMPDVEFLSPNGPAVCEAYPFGYQWFGLREFTTSYVIAGLKEARPFLRDWLIQELTKRGLSSQDLALVGFSQGGMVALDMMFEIPGLRGSICYSGGFYPPTPTPFLPSPPEVLLVHGDADTCVPYSSFSKAHRELNKLGFHPQTLTCSGLGHSIDEEGIKVGGSFLAQLFNQNP